MRHCLYAHMIMALRSNSSFPDCSVRDSLLSSRLRICIAMDALDQHLRDAVISHLKIRKNRRDNGIAAANRAWAVNWRKYKRRVIKEWFAYARTMDELG